MPGSAFDSSCLVRRGRKSGSATGTPIALKPGGGGRLIALFHEGLIVARRGVFCTSVLYAALAPLASLRRFAIGLPAALWQKVHFCSDLSNPLHKRIIHGNRGT